MNAAFSAPEEIWLTRTALLIVLFVYFAVLRVFFLQMRALKNIIVVSITARSKAGAPTKSNTNNSKQTEALPKTSAQTEVRTCDNKHHVEEEANAAMNTVPGGAQSLLLCTLTHELMVDPVLASDGNLYERDAIEQYISRAQLLLNAKPNLYPASHIKSVIEQLVADGIIAGTIVDSWEERKKQQQCEHLLLKKQS